MEFRKLGRTDVDVSALALGCWPFSGGTVWGYQSERSSIATVHAALDAGINLFDTAVGYAGSERILGQALSDRRERAVIATKAGGAHPDQIVASCEQSLENLQTDHIDLYQIHWPDQGVPMAETAAALDRLRRQGKIRAIGVCNFGVRDLSDFLGIAHCETDQLPYNLLWRAIEDEIQPACVANDVSIICYSPLAQGLLTDRYASPDEVPDGLSRTRLFSSSRPQSSHGEPGCELEAFGAIERVRRVARSLGESTANVSLAWVRQQRGVTSLLVGAREPTEIRQAVECLDVTLPPDVLRDLNEATDAVKREVGENADMWLSESRMR